MGSGTCQARVRGELPDGASTPGGAERSGANAVSEARHPPATARCGIPPPGCRLPRHPPARRDLEECVGVSYGGTVVQARSAASLTRMGPRRHTTSRHCQGPRFPGRAGSARRSFRDVGGMRIMVGETRSKESR